MAYGEELDARIRGIAGAQPRTSHRKMFEGVCHLLRGNRFGGCTGTT